MSNSPCRKPDGPYLIESAPRYREYLEAKEARESAWRIFSPLSICSAAITGYSSELKHMLGASAIYLGPGK